MNELFYSVKISQSACPGDGGKESDSHRRMRVWAWVYDTTLMCAWDGRQSAHF